MLKRLNVVMDRMLAQAMAALSWVAYAWVVMIALTQGRTLLTASDPEDSVGLKTALLAAALIVAFPRITDRVGLPRSWLLGGLRTFTVIVLLIFGGTTAFEYIAEESQLDPVEIADRKMRYDEKIRLEAIASSEHKAAPGKGSNVRDLTYMECVEQGIQWFKEIDSYPVLSNGEDATAVAKGRCLKTTKAFGPW